MSEFFLVPGAEGWNLISRPAENGNWRVRAFPTLEEAAQTLSTNDDVVLALPVSAGQFLLASVSARRCLSSPVWSSAYILMASSTVSDTLFRLTAPGQTRSTGSSRKPAFSGPAKARIQLIFSAIYDRNA